MSYSRYGGNLIQKLSPDIRNVLQQAAIGDNLFRLDDNLLQKMSNFVQQGKNADDGDEIQDYLLKFNYSVDFDSLLNNADDWIYDQSKRDFLIQVLLLNKIDIRVNNLELVVNILNKMFKTSKHEGEKQQIAEVAVGKFSLANNIFLDKSICKFYTNLTGNSESSSSVADKIMILEKKTNGFFTDPKFGNKSRIQENNSIISVIKGSLNEKFGNAMKGLYDEIESLFKIGEDINDDDYVRNYQLKKAKIFLILKIINSKFFRDSNNPTEIRRKINDIISSNNIENFVVFSENCDFDVSLSIKKNDLDKKDNNLFLIENEDIINCAGGLGDVKKNGIDYILNNTDYEDIDFFEIKDKSKICSNSFFYKTQQKGKKILIYFFSSQREQILNALYSNKESLREKKIDFNKSEFSSEIKDFINICEQVDSNIRCKGYSDVYDNFFIFNENERIGSLNNDAGFSTKVFSCNNSARRDISRYVVSTKTLLRWLKIQAKSGNPLREMVVSVVDIENLPAMLNEYFAYVKRERDEYKNNNLSYVRNLVIKNAKMLDDNKADDFFKNLDNNWKNCFLSLKIDDPFLAKKAKSCAFFKKNPYILFGSNNNFFSLDARNKRLLQKEIALFDKKNAKPLTGALKRIGDENSDDFYKFPNFDSRIRPQEEIKKESKRIFSTFNGNAGAANIDLNLNLNMNLDLDLDLEFLIEMNSDAKNGDFLNKGDLIDSKNVNKQIKKYLRADNKKLSKEVKEFLSGLSKQLNGDFERVFDIVTNRSTFIKFYKEINFKGSNFCFTLTAFISLLYEYFESTGIACYNGDYGKSELSVYQINDKNNQEPIYVVAAVAENVFDKKYSHPIKEMFARIPTSTVGVDSKVLTTYFNEEDIKNINSNIGILSAKLGSINCKNITNLFINNPISYSMESYKYISDNKDEILNFLNKISSNPEYKNICDSICNNFCLPEEIGNVRKKFSVVDPLKFARGLSHVFDTLDKLKKLNFIDNFFVGNLGKVLKKTKNKNAIQTIYKMLIRQKINVEKQIILFRNLNNNKGEVIDVEMDDVKAVDGYFKKHGNLLGKWQHFNNANNNREIDFSQMSFNSLLSYSGLSCNLGDGMHYNADVFFVDSLLDCGGIMHNNIDKSHCEISLLKNGKYNLRFKKRSDSSVDEFIADFSNLYHFLNKKYDRYSNYEVSDPNISDTEKYFINNKINFLVRLNSYIKTLKPITEGNKNFKLAYIFTYSILNCIEEKDFDMCGRIESFMDSVDSSTDLEIAQLYQKISRDKDNAISYLSCYYSSKVVGDDNLSHSGINFAREFDFIDEDKSFYFTESKKQQKKFLAKCWHIFMQARADYDVFFENMDHTTTNEEKIEYCREILKTYLGGYSCEAVMSNICEKIYDYGNFDQRKDEGQKKLISYILSSDAAFESILLKIYLNKQRYYSTIYNDYEFNDPDGYINLNDVVKYCFALNNNGDFSLLSNSEKQDLRHSLILGDVRKINSFINAARKVMIKIGESDFIAVLKKISFCAKKGLKFEDIAAIANGSFDERKCDNILAALSIYSSSEEVMKKNSFKEIYEFVDSLKKNSIFERYYTTTGIDRKFLLKNVNQGIAELFPKIVTFLNSKVIDASQRKYYCGENDDNIKSVFLIYFDNFTSLLEKFDKCIINNKDEDIAFDKERITQLMCKAHNSYKDAAAKSAREDIDRNAGSKRRFKDINEKVDYIINVMERIRFAYNDARDIGDNVKQSVLINLSGKINFLMDVFSLEDVEKFLRMIDKNLTTDLNILDKFNFLKEHYLNHEYDWCGDGEDYEKIYNEVTELHAADAKFGFLNSNLSHEQIMNVLRFRKKEEEERKSIISDLFGKAESLSSNFEKMVSKKRGNTGANNLFIKNFKTEVEKIASVASRSVERILGKKTKIRELLERIRKEYNITSDVLFRNENLAFFKNVSKFGDDATFDVAEDAKKVVEYITFVSSILLSDKDELAEVIEKYKRMPRGQKIDADEQIIFIAAFCAQDALDRGTALRTAQITASVLRNISMMRNMIPNNNFSSHQIILMMTGSGKTRTMFNNMRVASLNGKTPFALSTNSVLNKELIFEAEKSSIFEGRIFFINEDGCLINKATGSVVPIDDILPILEDNRNLFFSTAKDFIFWRRKLSLLGGEKGLNICDFIAKNGHVCIDEVDSFADPSTSNKLSTVYSGNSKDFCLALALQKCYLVLKRRNYFNFNQNINDDLKENVILDHFQFLLNNPNPGIRKVATDLLNELKKFDSSFDGLNFYGMKIELRRIFFEYFAACVEANSLKEGKDFIINVNSLTGYYNYFPINRGEPRKNGEKYSERVDLALKAVLKENFGYNCEGVFSKTVIASNESSFDVYKYFGSSLGVSGTVEGIKKIYNDRVIDTIGSEYVKNVAVQEYCLDTGCRRFPYGVTYTDNNNINKELETLFLYLAIEKAIKNIPNDNVIASLNEFLRSRGILDKYNTLRIQEQNHAFNPFLDKTDYNLTFCRDSKELNAFANILQGNLSGLSSKIYDDTGIKIDFPEIVKLDKNISNIDDFTYKNKMANAKKGRGVFVFALEDRERGFNFPGSPHLIVTAPTKVSRNIQTFGRTARGGRPGAITCAYAFKEGDFEGFQNAKFYLYINRSSSNFVKRFLEEKSKSEIKLFADKKEFFDIAAEVSEKSSIFLNLITQKCEEKKSEVFRDALVVLSHFHNVIEKKFNSLDLSIDNTSHVIRNFKFLVRRDLNKIFEEIYKYSFFDPNLGKPELADLIVKTNEIYLRTRKEIQNVPKTIDRDEEYIEVQENVDYNGDNFINLLNEKKRDIDSYYSNENYCILQSRDNNKIKISAKKIVNNCFFDCRFRNEKNYNVFFNFGIFGILDACGYNNVKDYFFSEERHGQSPLTCGAFGTRFIYDSDISVATKNVLSNFGSQLKTEKREIAVIGSFNQENRDAVRRKLSTLSEDALIVFVRKNGELSFTTCIQFLKNLDNNSYATSNSEIDVLIDGLASNRVSYIGQNISEGSLSKREKYKAYIALVLQKEVVKYYTEHKKMPDREYLEDLLNKFLDKDIKDIRDFPLRNRRLDSNEYKQAVAMNKEIFLQKQALGYVKSGIKLAEKKGTLFVEEKFNIDNVTKHFFKGRENIKVLLNEQNINELYEKYTNDLNDINFNIDLTDDELNKIMNNDEKMSVIFEKKISTIIGKAEELKNRIEEESELRLNEKENLLNRLKDIASKENIVKEAKRFMDIYAIIVNYQDVLSNLDYLIENFDINDIDNIELKLLEIEKNNTTGEEVLNKINEFFNSNERKIVATMHNTHNKVVGIINKIKSKISKIRKYKTEINVLDDKLVFFNGFDDNVKEGSVEFITEEMDTRKNKYDRMLAEIKNYNDDLFTIKEKKYLIENMRDKNLSSLVDLVITHENIGKLFNEFALRNYNNDNKDNLIFFDSEVCGEVENKLMKEIIDLYRERFGDIAVTAGSGDWIKICKEKYDPDNQLNIDDEEDRKALIESYEKDMKCFKEDIVDLMKDTFYKLSNGSGREDEYPDMAYGVFKNILIGLGENYETNLKMHRDVRNDIINTIISVSNRFKNVDKIHEGFAKDLFKIIEESVKNSQEIEMWSKIKNLISEKSIDELISEKSINELNKLLDGLDIPTLKKIKELLGVAVGKDIGHIEEVVKKLEEDKKIPLPIKIFVVILTFGLVLLTKEGKEMFKDDKQVEKVDIKSVDAKPKEYFIHNDPKGKSLAEPQKNINNILTKDEIRKPVKNEIQFDLPKIQNSAAAPIVGM